MNGPNDFPFRDSARDELARAIEAEQEPGRTSPWSSRRRLALVGLGVGVCAITLVVAIGGEPTEPGVDQAFAGAAVDVAETNSRVLIDAPGWSVTDVGEFKESSGSITFANGDQELTMNWTQIPEEWEVTDEEMLVDLPSTNQWYSLPGEKYFLESEVEVLGETAILREDRIKDGGEFSSRFEVRLPVVDGVLTTLYPALVNPDSFTREELEELLPSIERVDVDTWLSALPPSTVKPLERPEVIDEMLQGVPIPPSVEVEELKEQAIAAGRYQLGVQVTSAVACGWLDQWAEAIESGDQTAVEEATEAMSTSPEWDILQELDAHGDGWSQTVWEDAREMRGDSARNDLIEGGGTETFHGTTYETGPAYATGLGCDSLTRTVVEDPPNSAEPPVFKPVDGPPS